MEREGRILLRRHRVEQWTLAADSRALSRWSYAAVRDGDSRAARFEEVPKLQEGELGRVTRADGSASTGLSRTGRTLLIATSRR